MQHSDQRPPPSGRPSLLSSEQQAEADRHRILSRLEGQSNAKAVGDTPSGKKRMPWLAAGAVVLALAAGATWWLASEGDKDILLANAAPTAATPAVASASVPGHASAPAETAALAAASPADAAVGRGTAEDVSTAAILNDTPAIAEKIEPAAVGLASSAAKKPGDDDLTSLLEHGLAAGKSKPGVAPSETAPKKPAAAPAPTAAHAKPASATAKAAKKPTVGARAESTKATHRRADGKADAPVDSDVALLTALMAHMKATQPKTTRTAAKLRQCKSLSSVAAANDCGARICASAKAEPECKASNLKKARAEG